MTALLAAASTGEAAGLLCTLLLIVAVILTALIILSFLPGIGSRFERYGGFAGPVVGAVIAWILYVLLC